MAACIELDHVTKSYGATVAVNNLTLDIRRGEVFGLLGPNGAGKSTTLAMLSGLLRPTSGRIAVFGKDLTRSRREIMRRVGVLMERPAFFEHLSVQKNLAMLARLSQREVTIDRTLDLVGLLGEADTRVSALSLGQRQRLGLAQAFLAEPELLILDEPTSSLDPGQTGEIIELLRQLAEKASVTIVVSSHQLDEVESLCDRIAVIDRGRLVTCEETDALLSYDLTRVDVLLESPESAAKKLRGEDWVEEVEVGRGRIRVALREPSPQQLNQFLSNAGYQVMGIVPRRRSLQELYLKAKNR